MYALQMLAVMRAQELEREARARHQRRELTESHMTRERHGFRERLISWAVGAGHRRGAAGSQVSGIGRPPRAEGTIAPACVTCSATC